MDDLITPKEAADILKLDEQTVRRFLRDEVIEGYRLGHVWRISKSELDTWIKAQSNRATNGAKKPPPAKKAPRKKAAAKKAKKGER